jgi:hypothetical protein
MPEICMLAPELTHHQYQGDMGIQTHCAQGIDTVVQVLTLRRERWPATTQPQPRCHYLALVRVAAVDETDAGKAFIQVFMQ